MQKLHEHAQYGNAHLALKKGAHERYAHPNSPMGFDTLPLERCQLNPLGRKSVKEYFLSRGISNSLQPRLDSAALGFLVFGLHSDGDHHVARDRFHDAFRTGRKGCSPGSRENYDLRQDLFKLMCDAVSLPNASLSLPAYQKQACARDRLNGGCSITISLSGALRPGSHVTPENIKADVYLPRYLIEERPHFKPIIAALVQTFIENIGVEISERWLRGAAAMHWDFRGGETTALPGALPIFPESANDSCHYVFWGHTAGELEELIAAEQDPGHDAHQHAPEGTGPDPEVVRLTEEILRLNAENARLRELSEQQAAEIVALRAAEQQRAEEGTLLSLLTVFPWLTSLQQCALPSIQSRRPPACRRLQLLVLLRLCRYRLPWAAPLQATRGALRRARHVLKRTQRPRMIFAPRRLQPLLPKRPPAPRGLMLILSQASQLSHRPRHRLPQLVGAPTHLSTWYHLVVPSPRQSGAVRPRHVLRCTM